MKNTMYPYYFMLKNIQITMKIRVENGIVNENIPDFFSLVQSLSIILCRSQTSIVEDYNKLEPLNN